MSSTLTEGLLHFILQKKERRAPEQSREGPGVMSVLTGSPAAGEGGRVRGKHPKTPPHSASTPLGSASPGFEVLMCVTVQDPADHTDTSSFSFLFFLSFRFSAALVWVSYKEQ